MSIFANKCLRHLTFESHLCCLPDFHHSRWGDQRGGNTSDALGSLNGPRPQNMKLKTPRIVMHLISKSKQLKQTKIIYKKKSSSEGVTLKRVITMTKYKQPKENNIATQTSTKIIKRKKNLSLKE